MVKYLVKFTIKQKYACDLLNGILFMHTPSYYHQWEKDAGQADLGEASVFPNVCMYMHCYCPIYCMYTVEDSDIIDNNVYISEQVLKDFNCMDGYGVLIDYEQFVACLNKDVFEGHACTYGKVIYGNPTRELSEQMLLSQSINNLFLKRSFFKHQKEFRIVVHDSVEDVYEKRIYDGQEVDWLKEYGHKVYFLQNDIHAFAKMIPCKNLKKVDNNYILNFSNL